jgi:tRNA threonylcarbamoyladenosine biosynthesis protein TsaB
MDARMGEIFWGAYQQNEQGFAKLMGDEAVTLAENIVLPTCQGYGLGSAWDIYQKTLQQYLADLLLGFEADHLPRASAIAKLGVNLVEQNQAVAVEKAMPVYLRDKVAKKQSER